MEQRDRELLIRLDQKMDDVRSDVQEIKKGEKAQWEKIDDHTEKLADQGGSIKWLTWGFRSVAGAVVSGFIGLIYWIVKH